MLKKFGKVLFVGFFVFFVMHGSVTVFAAGEMDPTDFTIIPELKEEEISDVNDAIEKIGSKGGDVWDNYNEKADKLTTNQQVASGIMNWSTIMNYLVFVVQFLSQLGLVVGVLFIMYAGYKYIVSVFNGGKLPNETIKNAVIGVIVVIFSYAILKTLTALIGIS